MEIELKDLFRILWHRAWVILLAAVIGGTVAFAATYYGVTPLYTASSSMYVSNDKRTDTAITASDLSVSQSLVDTYIVILKSETLLSKVAKQLPYDYSTEQLGKMLSASSINGTEAFRISITNPDAEHAQTIVNTIAQVAPHEIIRVVKAGAVEVIDYAALPRKATWPLTRNAVIGAMLGFILACMGVLLINMADITIHSAEELSEYFEMPVLGIIPSVQDVETSRLFEREAGV